jgi:protein ImuB
MHPPYLAIRFPYLSADRCLRGGAPPDPPFVLVERHKNALRLAAVSPRALAQGLLPGLPLADARARLPGLAVFPHDPAADAALLRRLARHAQDYTPVVALEAPDALLLEIAGSAHLFSGAQGLAQSLLARLEAEGLHHAHAFGLTPDAALAFARTPVAGGDWRRLPAAALGLSDDAEAALRRAGLRTLADIAARPRRVLAARFGLPALTALDRIAGGVVRPLKPRQHRAALVFEQRLPEPLLTADSVDLILARLAARAATRMGRLGLGGRRFTASLFRTDGACHRLGVESGRPTRDPAAITALFAERIASLADPLDPGFGYDRFTLEVGAAEPLAATQPALDGDAGRGPALEALIDRLSVRFGADRLLRLTPADRHIPEQAQQLAPAGRTRPIAWPADAAGGGGGGGETPMRPLFLLDPPEIVEVLAEVPEGPPHRFRWRRQQHRIARAEGPERIAPEWWRSRSGRLDAGHTRDYWRVEDGDGRRFWLFRAGFYGADAPPRWYLHGLFA